MADWTGLGRRRPDRTSPAAAERGIPALVVTPLVKTPRAMGDWNDHGQVPAGEGRWWWVGLHGGAGVTTLSAAIPGGVDAEGVVPPPSTAHRPPVVCVVRSHAAGLLRAQEQAPLWHEHSDQYEVVGLVVVADAPGLWPKPIDQLLRLTAGGWPKVWRLPWVHAWRVGLEPDRTTTPKPYLTLARELGGRFGTTAPVMRLVHSTTVEATPALTVDPPAPERLPIGGVSRELLRRARRPRQGAHKTNERRTDL